MNVFEGHGMFSLTFSFLDYSYDREFFSLILILVYHNKMDGSERNAAKKPAMVSSRSTSKQNMFKKEVGRKTWRRK